MQWLARMILDATRVAQESLVSLAFATEQSTRRKRFTGVGDDFATGAAIHCVLVLQPRGRKGDRHPGICYAIPLLIPVN